MPPRRAIALRVAGLTATTAAALAAGAWSAGCAAYPSHLDGVLGAYAGGSRGATLRQLDTLVDGDGVLRAGRSPDRDRLVWLLERGKARFEAGLFAQSREDFDAADRAMEAFRRAEDEIDVPSQTVAVLWNDTVMSYRGRLSDRVLLRTYQALNMLALGDGEEAQVYLRLAFQAQQDAVARSAKRIRAAYDGAGRDAAVGAAVLESGSIAEATASLRTAVNPSYAPYANPLTSFLSGVTLLARGDLSNAAVDLERALAMEPEQSAVAAALADARAGGPAQPVVYVLHERGLVGRLGSTQAPIVQPFTGVSVVTIPRMEFPRSGAGVALVDGVRGDELADLNAVRAADLQREMPGIVMRQVISAGIKESATYFGGRAGGDGEADEWVRLVALLVGSLWKTASAGVDTRSWRLLGEDVGLARVPRPQDGEITVEVAGSPTVLTVRVPEAPISLVWMRSVAGGDLSAFSFGLPGGGVHDRVETRPAPGRTTGRGTLAGDAGDPAIGGPVR